MKKHTRTFKISESIPVSNGERWVVRDGYGRIIERWEVLETSSEEKSRYFTAEITTDLELE